MVEEGNLANSDEKSEEDEAGVGLWDCIWAPIYWFRMLAVEMHWSFVFGVIIVYGLSQGLGGSFSRLVTEYYMKDVQKVQPSEAQVYSGITNIPWIVKPLWGLLTDVIPIFGYRRRPYFILAGLVGIAPMLFLSMHKALHIVLAVLSLTLGSAGVAIADVTVDACVAQNSNKHQSLAADMQSLCALSSSIGALVGFSLSGILVHLIGPTGVYGLLTIPAALVFSVGVLLNEPRIPSLSYGQVIQKFFDATRAMWMTLKLPVVWRPCLYMYLSLALSLNIHEGMFYWYTGAETGPHFTQEFVGYQYSIGSIGSLVGAILYQYILKDHHFRDVCFWTQLFYGLFGMLDLMLVLRLNIKFGISDYFFAAVDECIHHMIGRLKWMPLLVLSSKLCPPGIEGTFFALLMSIDNVGFLTSAWGGGFLMHILNITRTKFDNLWIAILIRNLLRILTVGLLFLVPRADPNSSIVPADVSIIEQCNEAPEPENIELVSLINNAGTR
ncbi:hypothetical protein Nepgr_001150 [Nepenthes gracilis]|uniref:Folate-biopterin transporter 2 n=1 Tax=Nepenthes gracilis TaxID=150966 RepID=A0AAD3P4C4_NEPGR|nr:hypothetical protein Nepgr_001150 [Nepenthes gracilis]